MGTLNNRCRIIIGTQKGTIILTTTHVRFVVALKGFSAVPRGSKRLVGGLIGPKELQGGPIRDP